MKRIPTAALALCLLLSLTACGEQSSGKIPGGKGDLSEKPNPDVDTVTGEAAQAALDLLRQCMADSPKVAAVAYLGYRDATEQDGDLTDWLWTNVPGLMEEMAFLQSIPTDRVLNGGCGDLYCIVPRDEHTSLAVNHVVWRSNERGVWPVADDVLYRSESAEPLLLDFSSFGDVTGLDYEGNLWAPPTALGLANTVWNCGSWMLELNDGGSDPDYAGTAQLSYQQEDGQEYRAAYSGAWRMENDCLRLELSAGVGTSLSGSFPVYIDLSGEHLMLHRDGATHAGLPFFADDANYMELTLSYG